MSRFLSDAGKFYASRRRVSLYVSRAGTARSPLHGSEACANEPAVRRPRDLRTVRYLSDGHAPVTDRLPNLLYIHSDQHAQRVLDCYGDPHIQASHLGRLARRGVVFDNAYCDSPICVPSRMSMLTARRPHENQVWTNEHQLDSRIPTLAHALGAAGYDPVLIGRMHALGPDQLRGYTRREVGDHGPNQLGGRDVDRGALDGTAGPHRISLRKSGSGQSAYQVHDEEVFQSAAAFLRAACRDLQQGHRQEPFNLSVGFMLPHPPYVARQEDFDLFAGDVALPRKGRVRSDERHPFLRWWRRHTDIETVSEAEIRRARAAYWALVHRLDQWIGQLVRIVEESGQTDNTLIVYTSDHGDMLGERGLWWKHLFYEESAKVPLIMSWPSRLPRGTRCSRVVNGVDVTATLLELMGAPPLPNASGRSFASVLTNPTRAVWEDRAVSEYCSHLFAPEGGCFQRMLRREEWKLVYYHEQPAQLFNLARDPEELEDLAADPRYAAVRAELQAEALADWNPEAVARIMEELSSANSLLEKWGRRTRVADSLRWPLDPALNYLDPVPDDA